MEIIMDYEKAYKEALERARDSFTYPDYPGFIRADVVFPELAESEDERIRKELLEHCINRRDGKQICVDASDYRRWAAWLEKQAEQKSIMNVPSREVILSIWDLGNEWKELTGGSISTKYDTQLKYIQKHWQESEYYLRAKQGEQKPVNEVEPKFKDGDWITNSIETVQITGYDIDYGYQVDYRGNLQHRDTDIIEKEYHLWAIQDTKDGDILIANEINNPFILKALNSKDYPIVYCGIDAFDSIYIGTDTPSIYKDVRPATLNEKERLFKKLEESGYKWDAEKKELKKIEFNPDDLIEESYQQQADDLITMVTEKSAWSEEDNLILSRIIADYERSNEEWFNAQNSLPHGRKITWLKSLKNRIQSQPKQEWSEEDESYLNTTIAYLKDAKEFKKTAENCIDWLKSLKPQNRWKPSDEQMNLLEELVEDNNQRYFYTTLNSLYEQLKSLKGE